MSHFWEGVLHQTILISTTTGVILEGLINHWGRSLCRGKNSLVHSVEEPVAKVIQIFNIVSKL